MPPLLGSPSLSTSLQLTALVLLMLQELVANGTTSMVTLPVYLTPAHCSCAADAARISQPIPPLLWSPFLSSPLQLTLFVPLMLQDLTANTTTFMVMLLVRSTPAHPFCAADAAGTSQPMLPLLWSLFLLRLSQLPHERRVLGRRHLCAQCRKAWSPRQMLLGSICPSPQRGEVPGSCLLRKMGSRCFPSQRGEAPHVLPQREKRGSCPSSKKVWAPNLVFSGM